MKRNNLEKGCEDPCDVPEEVVGPREIESANQAYWEGEIKRKRSKKFLRQNREKGINVDYLYADTEAKKQIILASYGHLRLGGIPVSECSPAVIGVFYKDRYYNFKKRARD